MNHSQDAIDSAIGSTWSLDDTALKHDWEGVGILYGRHRDSDVMINSNWKTLITAMQEFPENAWHVISLGHWAVGWVSFIIFDVGNPTIAKLNVDTKRRLDNYPVLDEDLYSEMEWEENHPSNKECYCGDEACSIKLNQEADNGSD